MPGIGNPYIQQPTACIRYQTDPCKRFIVSIKPRTFKQINAKKLLQIPWIRVDAVILVDFIIRNHQPTINSKWPVM